MSWFLNITLVYSIAFLINWIIVPCYPLEYFVIGYILTLSIPWYIGIKSLNGKK
jgi:hypothetical protein